MSATATARAWRRQQAEEWAAAEGVTHVTTRAGRRGQPRTTLHTWECPIVKRLNGGMTSSVRKADPELFARMAEGFSTYHYCPTCKPTAD